ncbi:MULTISPECIES: hypothetical protein [unclassified Roseofilum]|uniref:Cap15 family cyclic dinucleotide receptor domain-containing protein n=1 Tax=unclassified Roseofilum TaxID=2620099 RepID=UPI001B079F0F|nr:MULTISPECIES: hypothetical protein [unclassified Roseofilum]MBP0006905.1 hypothetical protein [Roseofilum sp. Belize Diploria]MBP0031998.1 hypothetical protein [Roseofilum sp. Belize BBD 4]MBP0043354.1 hypothetical protein [Roseofilum sp. SBFL]
MHAYATNASERKSTPIWLAFFAIVASLILSSGLQLTKLQAPWWLDSPSVMGFYGLIYQWFDKYLWCQQFKFISFSSIPNLQGTWVGVIHSSYSGETNVPDTTTDIPDVILYVRQTWTQLNVRLTTQNSSSYSIMGTVNTHKSSEPCLKYEYMNEPSALSIDTMNAHRGTANLQLSPDGQELAGDYFTGRGRQNIGKMEFKRVSREYLTRVEALRRVTQ